MHLLLPASGHSHPSCIQHTEVPRAGSGHLCLQNQRRGGTMAGMLGNRKGRSALRELWAGRRRQWVLWEDAITVHLFPVQLRACLCRVFTERYSQLRNSISLACLLGACPVSWEEPFSCPNPRSFMYLHVSAAIAMSEPHYEQVLKLY